MKLGAFSLSLSVQDLNASRIFYEKLGFRVFAGDSENNYLILKNGDTLIGLFEGMFDDNILTFNPGWDQNADKIQDFDDVRDLQERLKSSGINVIKEVDTETAGPGSFVIADPDGNPILIDQHV